MRVCVYVYVYMYIYKNYAQRLFTYRCLSLNILIHFGAKHITKLPVVFFEKTSKIPLFMQKKGNFFPQCYLYANTGANLPFYKNLKNKIFSQYYSYAKHKNFHIKTTWNFPQLCT